MSKLLKKVTRPYDNMLYNGNIVLSDEEREMYQRLNNESSVIMHDIFYYYAMNMPDTDFSIIKSHYKGNDIVDLNKNEYFLHKAIIDLNTNIVLVEEELQDEKNRTDSLQRKLELANEEINKLKNKLKNTNNKPKRERKPRQPKVQSIPQVAPEAQEQTVVTPEYNTIQETIEVPNELPNASGDVPEVIFTPVDLLPKEEAKPSALEQAKAEVDAMWDSIPDHDPNKPYTPPTSSTAIVDYSTLQHTKDNNSTQQQTTAQQSTAETVDTPKFDLQDHRNKWHTDKIPLPQLIDKEKLVQQLKNLHLCVSVNRSIKEMQTIFPDNQQTLLFSADKARYDWSNLTPAGEVMLLRATLDTIAQFQDERDDYELIYSVLCDPEIFYKNYSHLLPKYKEAVTNFYQEFIIESDGEES